MENLSTQLDQFSSNTQWISHEIQRVRKEMDQLVPKSNFSPYVEQRSSPSLIIGSLVIFIPATLLFDALATRIAFSIIFVLALYEAVTMSVESRPDGQESVVSGAGISALCLAAIISVWALTSSEILILALLTIGAHTLGNIADQHHDHQLLPRPCPNLCLQKTWLGIISTIALPATIVSGAIWLQWLTPEYWSFAGIGLTTVLADLLIALAKRHHGFRYSNQATHFSLIPNERYVNFLHRYLGDERGLLDRFAPLILSSILLFCLKL